MVKRIVLLIFFIGLLLSFTSAYNFPENDVSSSAVSVTTNVLTGNFTNISQASDTNITYPSTNGYVLTWNSATSKWTPTVVSAGAEVDPQWTDNFTKYNGTWSDKTNTSYVTYTNLSNSYVNSSNNWDSYNTANTSQISNVGGVLTILTSYLSEVFNTLFGLKTTDNLAQGTTNLYDNQSWNFSRYWTNASGTFAQGISGDITAVNPNDTYIQINNSASADVYIGFNESRLNTTINFKTNQTNASGLIRDWNVSGYIRDWNVSGFIKDWNSSGWIINWSQVIISSGDITAVNRNDTYLTINNSASADVYIGVNETTLNRTIDSREKFNTTEEMQDAVGGAFDSNFTYNDSANTITVMISNLATTLRSVYDTVYRAVGTLIGNVDISPNAINTTQIINGGIKDIDLDLSNITLNDFTNDASYRTLTNNTFTGQSNFTGNVNVTQRNVTDISYGIFTNGTTTWRQYVNESGWFIIERI